jgi:hypothetical protein
MSSHRYVCGQHVTFTGKRVIRPNWTGAFVIARLLPSGDEEPRYEIKSREETFSRVALENELSTGSEASPPSAL